MVVMDIYQYTKFHFSTPSGYWDTLVETEEGQQQQQQQQQQGENEELWKWTLTTFPLSDFGHFLRTPIFWP